MIPRPPILEELRAGTKLHAGLDSYATVTPDLDFETYSEAGFIWNPQTRRYMPPPNCIKKGLPVIGAAVYSEHESTEVLSAAYDLKDGKGKRLWIPGMSPPFSLFEYLQNGGILECWNAAFERWIWTNVCVRKYGWPQISFRQLRCAMAKARAFGLPGSLDAAGNVLNIRNKKNEDGKRLLNKFSMPRNPTIVDARQRIKPENDPEDAKLLYLYNLQDIAAEAELSSLVPDLSPNELELWYCDQAINVRGVQVDIDMIKNCIKIVEKAHEKYNAELKKLTNNAVSSASELQKLRNWLSVCGVSVPTLDADDVSELLKDPTLSPTVRRVLEIRELIGSAAVKKIYAMQNQATKEQRVHDVFIYHSARTGRAAGTGPQPQNFPNSGPEIAQCHKCAKYYGLNAAGNLCPWCGFSLADKAEWNPKAMEDAFETIATGNLECVEYCWGDAIDLVSGCLRGLFISKPGYDLICSDYSAIEAVVLAALAGEEWRMDVFRTHGKIYEMSASKITGIPFEEFIRHKNETGQHHPMRKKVGKVAELASGYQGWIGAWKQFGADEFFNDEEMKQAILAWRLASPAIVEFWGGQIKDWSMEYYGLEGMAVLAVMNPGTPYLYRGIQYVTQGDTLYCRLLSGRYLTYHRPRLAPSDRRKDTYSLSFEGWNTNAKYGGYGWMRMDTYGGKLTENVVQATARDILAHAIINLEKKGYPVVLHVHDEIVSEVPENTGSIAEFEEIMSTLPSWCADWPVVAKGGWRAKRYTK